MTELSRLISRLQRGIARKSSYIKTIRHPHLLVASLQELNNLIGNDKVKDAVATQVSHLIMIKRRALDNPNVKEDDVMLNTVLYGPPGVGKTLIGTKLAKIWYSLGYLGNSKNNKERKQELGEMLKDLFRDNGGFGTNSSTDDSALAIYMLFIFVVIFITILSMTWSFYSKFGGMWTGIVIVLIVVIIIAVGYYISISFNGNNSNLNSTFDSKGVNCNGNGCSKNTPKDNIGVKNRSDTNEVGETMSHELPADAEVITIASRADCVDRYVGWSDKKTLKLLNENLGKVLFIDEAYALVTDMHDSFGMEVLNTINLFISQHPGEIIVIFAGYKDLMENGIFSFQPGLRRRFMWQFDCSGYSQDQMFEVFKMQLHKKGWGLTDDEASRALFEANFDAFPGFGGDTERLTFFAELEHSRDFISNEKGMFINKLTPEHIRRGLLKLRENNIQGGEETESSNPLANMMKLFRDGGNARKQNKSDEDMALINAIRNTSNDRAFH